MTRIATCVGAGLAFAFVTFDVGSVFAQDFFSQFFGGGFSRRVERPYQMNYAPDYRDDNASYGPAPRSRRRDDSERYSSSGGGGGGGSQAFCVRTCDGRHFPIAGQGEQSKAATCKSFCPQSETKVFYGSSIDTAVSDKGGRYSDLPNAFKYRNELVAGCTCNGATTGLSPVKVEDDPTLKRGDIVAGADGLTVSRTGDRRGASLDLSPVSSQIKAKYERAPIAD